jgi:hypothetical protein
LSRGSRSLLLLVAGSCITAGLWGRNLGIESGTLLLALLVVLIKSHRVLFKYKHRYTNITFNNGLPSPPKKVNEKEKTHILEFLFLGISIVGSRGILALLCAVSLALVVPDQKANDNQMIMKKKRPTNPRYIEWHTQSSTSYEAHQTVYDKLCM